MKAIYSTHVMHRMAECGISEDEVQAILWGYVCVIEIPSRSDPDVVLILGYVKERGLVVIFNRITYVIITVRPMRKKEKDLFKEV